MIDKMTKFERDYFAAGAKTAKARYENEDEEAIRELQAFMFAFKIGILLETGWKLLKSAEESAAGAVQKAQEGVKNFFGGIWDATVQRLKR